MRNVIRLLFISVVITFTGLYLFLRANAAPLLIVPALPAGKCVDVGSIAGMVKETGPADVTYFGNKSGATIQSPLTIASPFQIAMYDADGAPETNLSLLNHGAQVWQHSFKTANNEWSEVLTVTVSVDALTLTLPSDHASTHLCLIPPAQPAPPTITETPELTETPTDVSTPEIVQSSTPTPQSPTVTATATQEATSTPVLLIADLRIEAEVAGYMSPTGLTPAPQPIHMAAVNDNVPVVPIGSTVIITIAVTNRGNTSANDVSLDIVTNGLTETITVGRIASGVRVVEQYLTVVTEGLTIATITARSSTHDTDPSNNVQSVLWMAGDDGEVCGQSCDNVRVWLPVIQR